MPVTTDNLAKKQKTKKKQTRSYLLILFVFYLFIIHHFIQKEFNCTEKCFFLWTHDNKSFDSRILNLWLNTVLWWTKEYSRGTLTVGSHMGLSAKTGADIAAVITTDNTL